MRWWLVSIVLLASCGSTPKQPQPQPLANVAPAREQPAPVVQKTEIAQMRDEICACADPTCVDRVTKKWAAVASAEQKEPTAEEMRDGQAILACVQKIFDRAAQPPAYSSGVAECDAVVTTYERYFQCGALQAAGQAAIQAQRDALDALKQAFGDLRNAPQATKDAMAEGCKQALDGLKQGAAAMGCPL